MTKLERFLAKQIPEALEKTGFDFNRWDEWRQLWTKCSLAVI